MIRLSMRHGKEVAVDGRFVTSVEESYTGSGCVVYMSSGQAFHVLDAYDDVWSDVMGAKVAAQEEA